LDWRGTDTQLFLPPSIPGHIRRASFMVVTLRLDYHHYHSAELSGRLPLDSSHSSPQPRLLLPPSIPDHIAKRYAAVLGSLPCDMLAM
jgi:hypothetical protein